MQKANICSREGEQGKEVYKHKRSEGRKAAQQYTDHFRRSVITRAQKSGTERNSKETQGRHHIEHIATMKHIVNSSSAMSLPHFLSFLLPFF